MGSAAVWDFRASHEFRKDLNGDEEVVLRNPRGASVLVRSKGGQVISWKNDKGEELLFTSTKSTVKSLFSSSQSMSPKTTRGGICVCFFKFGNYETLEQYGYSRNKIWAFEKNPPPLHPKDSAGKSYVDLVLRAAEKDFKFWPHGFEIHLRVSLALDGNLTLISRIRNISVKPFSFSFVYRSYFNVSDISEVRVEGLETVDYLDNLCERERFTEQGDALTFESEVDRVYLSSPPCVAVMDHERKRTYVMRKEGLPDTVVWNPWDKKSKTLPDFGANDYRQMLCVDGAAIEKNITLKSGQEWTAIMEVMCLPTTICTDALPPRFKYG